MMPPDCEIPANAALFRFSLRSLLLGIATFAVACWLSVTFHPFGPLYAWMLFAAGLGAGAWRRRRVSLAIISATMFVIALLTFPMISMSGHPASMHRLSQIRVGSTAAEVRSLLGPPTRIKTLGEADVWVYSGATWCYIQIWLLPDGTVVDVVHDH